MIKYAEENGWKFLDSKDFTIDSMLTWIYHNNPIFPLYYPKHSKTFSSNSVNKFPRHIMSKCTVMKFDSGWIREDPGTGETSIAFGYVLLSEDGKKLVVYHFWGNG